jgi:metallo-beta-lactamase family protein
LRPVRGSREIELGNADPFEFDPASIDALLLTHAHGSLRAHSLLVKQGFRGRIHATAATRELARVVLLDAAGLQEEQARRAAEHNRPGEEIRPPLYTIDDALHAFDFFAADVTYGETVAVVEGMQARFRRRAHSRPASVLLFEVDDGKRRDACSFRAISAIRGGRSCDPMPAPEADYVIMESTYGDRAHRSMPDSIEELYEAIRTTAARHGNVIIPTFALERTQEVLYYLHFGIRTGALPRQLRVFLDSPMAISATEIFRRHPECFDLGFIEELKHGDPFDMPGLHFTAKPRSRWRSTASEAAP